MRPTRIFVVDDSLVVRNALSGIIRGDPQLEMAGTAATGLMALELLPRVSPDLVILDIEMPGMHGLQVLGEIRRRDPDLSVIMFNTPTERSASATFEALAAGAKDFILKPSADGTLESALASVKEQLFGKIKTLFHHQPVTPRRRTRPRVTVSMGGAEAPRIIAIGCSTGGPNALSVLLSKLRANLAAPVLVVQHMPPIFTKTMAARLDGQCELTVQEARDGVRPRAGEVWVAPGDHHIVARKERGDLCLRLDDSPPVNSCRPSVDVLLESLAEEFGRETLAVMLTGMGSDGLNGCVRIDAAGGQVVAQDRDSSVVWGMPGAVVEAGLADRVFPLEEMAGEISRRVGRNRCHAGAAHPRPPAGGSKG